MAKYLKRIKVLPVHFWNTDEKEEKDDSEGDRVFVNQILGLAWQIT